MATEFHEVYVYNLRGNTRGSGDSVRREGGKVFGQGSRATVAVLLLVKRPEAVTERAKIRYSDIGDYLSLYRSWFLGHFARGNHAAAAVLGESAWRTAAGVR